MNRINGYLCGSCRINKCFAIGMQVELLRNGQAKSRILKKQDLKRRMLITDERVMMTTKQWSLLMSIKQNHAEVNQLLAVDKYIQKQNELPPKMRFKISSVQEFLTSNVYKASEHLFENSSQMRLLSVRDSLMLMQKTIGFIKNLNIWWLIYRSALVNYPQFHQTCTMIYDNDRMRYGEQCLAHLSEDVILMELMMKMLIFSTMNYENDFSRLSSNCENSSMIVDIQNQYVDLTWHHLAYQHGAKKTVKIFADLIRSLFNLQKSSIL